MPESSFATDKGRPRITVVYASATGTAQDLAYRVSRVAQRHHFPVDVISVEEIRDLNQLRSAATHGPLVFLVATAGNGAFPPTAFDLWQSLLSGQLSLDTELRGLQYAIYGLGDSTYPRFCWPERMMRKRLMDLGAVELARDEGDEQHYLGLDGTFQPFVQGLFEALNRSYPLPDHLHVLPDEVALPPSVELRLIKDGEARQVKANACSARDFKDGLTPTTQQTDHKGTRWLRLVKNQRLTSPDHFQDVRLIELETPSSSEAPLQFQAGDIAALRPVNDISDCESLLTRMGWANSQTEHIQLWDNLRDRPVQLPPIARPPTLRREMVKDYRPTLIEYIQYHANPFAPLRPSFFPLIRPFATSELEREKLDEFCTPGDGYDDAMEYAVRQKRTVKEALDEFKSVQLPIERAAECLGGQMREREFSIASSPTSSPRKIQLIIAIVRYQTRIREPRRGVATHWLSALDPADPALPLIAVSLRPSPVLTLPPSSATPIIAVGPGTGVAPLRGLILERISSGGPGALAENNLMFLGCRHALKDRLLGDEWAAMEKAGQVQVHWATSRTDIVGQLRPGGEKQYVQDVIASKGELVWDMLLRGAWFYICGSSGKMPEQVRQTVIEIVRVHGGLEIDQATRFVLERLENAGRWREECWS